jgi:hypothetical protein
MSNRIHDSQSPFDSAEAEIVGGPVSEELGRRVPCFGLEQSTKFPIWFEAHKRARDLKAEFPMLQVKVRCGKEVAGIVAD